MNNVNILTGGLNKLSDIHFSVNFCCQRNENIVKRKKKKACLHSSQLFLLSRMIKITNLQQCRTPPLHFISSKTLTIPTQ